MWYLVTIEVTFWLPLCPQFELITASTLQYVVWGMSPKRIYPYRGPLITSGIGDLCDGPFRRERAAFRVDIGNEGWNFVVGGIGGDPNVATLDFVNGLNKSRLNAPLEKRNSALGDEALFGKQLVDRLHEKFARQFRCGFLIEQTPDRDNRVTLSSDHKDGLGLPRPQISYNLSDYTRRGFIAAYRMKNLLFGKMSLTEFTEIGPEDPTRFEEEVDGKPVTLNYIGAGHIMGTCRMGHDSKQSVVDKFQRSHDHKNLYLVGSSTFPTGATANPTLTIAALSLEIRSIQGALPRAGAEVSGAGRLWPCGPLRWSRCPNRVARYPHAHRFFDPVACSRASLRISASSVFLPRSR
jgi:glucose dehydrogenase